MFIKSKLNNRKLLDNSVKCNIIILVRRSKQWIMGMLLLYSIMSFMIVKVASATALYQQQQHQEEFLNRIQPTTDDFEATLPSADGDNTSNSSAQAAERSNIEKMRAKLQQLQHEQQQQYRLQQQHMQQHLQQLQEMHASASVNTGETAYLLERADDTAHEQPIYGTWRTKARRPQPPGGGALQHATSTATLNALDDDYKATTSNQHQQQSQQQQQHYYERLPKRAATMTPLKGLLRDQLPRPPRLPTQRPASTALVRRQYSESAGSLALRDDYKPKPFHFPYEGPLPEQFKKDESQERPPELNNIQDILQHLHINAAPSKTPQMVMLPTGLHIAGSIKNLKSSGIGNFFRGKRNKKQLQFTIPLPMSMAMPMHMPMAMPLQLYGSTPQPGPAYYNALPQAHQRVAIEQLYQYKPRSPQDINLLAMQQQQQQQQQSRPPSKASKQKKKKHQQQQQQAISNHNMLLEHGSQQQFMADTLNLQNFPPIIALNATRQPQMKRIPFKVNLDIYPVMPPTKDYRPFNHDDMRHLSPTRPGSVLRHPFHTDYMGPSLAPSAAALSASAAVYGQHGGIYQAPFRFPPPPSSLMPISFPDQATRYSQQQSLYQAHKYAPQQSFQPDDCIYPQPNGNNAGLHAGDTQSSNQIMLHLNVFPKQKPASMTHASTNPFYSNSNTPGVQRHTINELPEPASPIEPRHVAAGSMAGYSNNTVQPQNYTQLQQSQPSQQLNHSISRSDHFEAPLQLIDFEHPIVAAELPELPQPAAFTGNRLQPPQAQPQPQPQPHANNYRYSHNGHIDQLAAEAQTASLFRFPVEDLIQFQVDDAL